MIIQKVEISYSRQTTVLKLYNATAPSADSYADLKYSIRFYPYIGTSR